MNYLRRAGMLTASIGVAVLLTSCRDAASTLSSSPTTPRLRPPLRRGLVTSRPRAHTGCGHRPRRPLVGGVPRRHPAISERDSARILEVADNGGTRAIGTVEGLTRAGEGGLLGLALDDQDRLYVYSTAADGNRIQRFTVTGAAGSLSLGQPETLVDRMPSASYHDGGRIDFGPDDMLYATLGDAGDSSSAQDLESLGGKFLRMTPE